MESAGYLLIQTQINKIFNQTQEVRMWAHHRPEVLTEFNFINTMPPIFEACEIRNELFLKTFILNNLISILGFYLSL